MIEDLYDLIGGPRTIEAATKLFYEKILQDESLRHFFEGVDMAHIRSRQAMLVFHASRRADIHREKYP